MARSAAISVENNFIRGLVTEATALNFPENACTETWNCVFDHKGKVTRRPGFEYETSYATRNVYRNRDAFSTYIWENVGEDGRLQFVVVQTGLHLHFYQLVYDESLSPNIVTKRISMKRFRSHKRVKNASQFECSFAQGVGVLFVCHPLLDPFYVKKIENKDGSTNFKADVINVKIRDFKGIPEGIGITLRPSVLTQKHKYNLYNQGWTFNASSGAGGGTQNVLESWYSTFSNYPSSSDVWWHYKDSDESIAGWSMVQKRDYGSTPAPKGHFILDAFNQDRQGASGIAGTRQYNTVSRKWRPKSVKFFAGRVFYGGIDHEDYNNRIYFSQIIENNDTDQFGRCYQRNDPTAEDLSDLLPTDGGEIVVHEVAEIVGLEIVNEALVVFGTNGIWSISGPIDGAFSADEYKISKISDVKCLSSSSIVMVEGVPIWWTEQGIYRIVIDPTFGNMSVENLTDEIIQKFYSEIPLQAKKYATGSYNPSTKLVQWLYRSNEKTILDRRYEFNRVLNLNTISGAWYPWDIDNNTVVIHGIVNSVGRGGMEDDDLILHNGAVMYSYDPDARKNTSAVTKEGDFIDATVGYTTKYLVSEQAFGKTYSMTWAECFEGDYLDWITATTTGVDYSSYGITGYKIHGDAIKKFQSNYIYWYMDKEDTASCKIKGVWDWSTSINSYRESALQQAYKERTYQDISYARLKVRGNGKSLQLKFQSDTGKPFTIVGWGIFETSNAGP